MRVLYTLVLKRSLVPELYLENLEWSSLCIYWAMCWTRLGKLLMYFMNARNTLL